MLAAVVIAVLAVALILVRRALESTAEGLAHAGRALETVESEHLRATREAVQAINAQFDVILGRCRESRPRPRSSPQGGLDDPLLDR